MPTNIWIDLPAEDTSSSVPVNVVITNFAKTPTVYNVSALLANTEYSQALSNGTKRFTMKSRLPCKIQFSYTSGQSGSVFVTIPYGASYEEEFLDLSGKTIYFQTDKASQVIEIVQWA